MCEMCQKFKKYQNILLSHFIMIFQTFKWPNTQIHKYQIHFFSIHMINNVYRKVKKMSKNRFEFRKVIKRRLDSNDLRIWDLNLGIFFAAQKPFVFLKEAPTQTLCSLLTSDLLDIASISVVKPSVLSLVPSKWWKAP